MKKSISLADLSEDFIDIIIFNKEFKKRYSKKKLYVFLRIKSIPKKIKSYIFNHIESNSLCIFPNYFYIVKANKIIPKTLLNSIDKKGNSYLLINSQDKNIFVINNSIKYFLEQFNKPNSSEKVMKNLLDENSQDVEKNTIENFFNQMICRGFLANSCKNEKFPIRHFQDFKILYVLKKTSVITVAIAEDIRDNKKVILKFLNKECANNDIEDVNLFRHEFNIMNRIGQHPLIRSLLFFDKSKNLAVLEFIKGRELQNLIRIGKLRIKHKLYLAHQIIESLSYIHEKKIIHGDIHINQFLIEPNLKVKLIDFEMSYIRFDIENMEPPCVRGGIYHYIEPENISENIFTFAKNIPNLQADIYRLGIVLYFLFYEKFPFDSFSWKKLCHVIKSEEPVFESSIKGEQIPEFIITIIKKSLQKNPELRYNSTTEIISYFDIEYNKHIL